jgi:3-deoxy-D-manno-octulosonic-acid transferase
MIKNWQAVCDFLFFGYYSLNINARFYIKPFKLLYFASKEKQMRVIYDASIFLYHLLIRILVPFNKKAKLYIQGRENWLAGLQASIDKDSRYIWFHCASLGEFEQGRPVMEAIRRMYPQYKLILSFFSPSGYEIRKNYPLADVVCYLPADTSRNATLFIDTIHPEKVFFIKYEFWYHFLRTLAEKKIPVYLVSGIFRKSQRFFSKMPWGAWFRQIPGYFTHIFLQDEGSAELLSEIGTRNLTISGDTRFDRVASIAKSSQLFPVVDKFMDGKPLVIAGSTWEPDEDLLVPFINKQTGLKFIIVPHEISPPHLNRLTRMLKKPAVLFSQLNEADIHLSDVIIVDSIGLLSGLYRYGTFAYIGGGFGAGIHNILEAATFGLPVFFGPRYGKFREACQLIDLGGAFSVTSAEAFENALLRLMDNSEELEKTSRISSDFIKNNQGSTDIILQNTFPELPL